METINGDFEKEGPPPPSPLTGCYLLIVVGEPHNEEHKDIILQRIAKGLLSWNVNECLVDLEKELAVISEQALEGEEARHGERLIQFASENLVTEILIHPVVSTLIQCMRNLLSSFTRHRHIIHAGYTFAANGSWALQDGTFSYADFSEAFLEVETQRVIHAYENGISLDLHCSSEGDWCKLPKEPFAKSCNLRVNPTDVLTCGSPSITEYINYISQFLIPAPLENLLQCSDVVGNIRFSRPTLYVFPGGQGDAALFGVNGFNMLLDGGFSRKACFWDFVRHLDRLDAVLMTRLNNSNIGGISSILRRKRKDAVYPHLGHFFCNIQDRKTTLSPDGDKDRDPLLIDLLNEGQEIISNLHYLSLNPQVCYRDTEPINLYHKVGHGTLNMYVLNPARDSKEVKEFLQKWNQSDQKLFSKQQTKFTFPIQNLISIAVLLIWQPANITDTITRILYPGSSPQQKIFEGLERLKNIEFIKHPVCSEKSLFSKYVVKKSAKNGAAEKVFLKEKYGEKKEKLTVDNNITAFGGEIRDRNIKKSDSTESERTKVKKIEDNKTIIENDEKIKMRTRKFKTKNEIQQRKKSVEKTDSPTTPKKIIEHEESKKSVSSTPAKSTKDANNRKVIENKSKSLKSIDSKGDKRTISRKPKGLVKAPISPAKRVTNGLQKVDSAVKKAKLDKDGTTDSSTVSTPTADQESLKKDISNLTSEQMQQLKAQELTDLDEEQEAIKEIEAVFRKSEVHTKGEENMRKVKSISIEEDKSEKEEYLIIEREDIDGEFLDRKEAKEMEFQKLTRDSEESEKQRSLIVESVHSQQNIKEIKNIVKPKEVPGTVSKSAAIINQEEKADNLVSEKKSDRDVEVKDIGESHPDEKMSANIKSGDTTTAPTLPEDERIPLDEIKEDNGYPIEEKYAREETKEKGVPVIQLPPKTFDTVTRTPAVVGIRLDKQSHIRDIVKTPDEVADLPVHEEADYEYANESKTEAKISDEDLHFIKEVGKQHDSYTDKEAAMKSSLVRVQGEEPEKLNEKYIEEIPIHTEIKSGVAVDDASQFPTKEHGKDEVIKKAIHESKIETDIDESQKQIISKGEEMQEKKEIEKEKVDMTDIKPKDQSGADKTGKEIMVDDKEVLHKEQPTDEITKEAVEEMETDLKRGSEIQLDTEKSKKSIIIMEDKEMQHQKELPSTEDTGKTAKEVLEKIETKQIYESESQLSAEISEKATIIDTQEMVKEKIEAEKTSTGELKIQSASDKSEIGTIVKEKVDSIDTNMEKSALEIVEEIDTKSTHEFETKAIVKDQEIQRKDLRSIDDTEKNAKESGEKLDKLELKSTSKSEIQLDAEKIGKEPASEEDKEIYKEKVKPTDDTEKITKEPGEKLDKLEFKSTSESEIQLDAVTVGKETAGEEDKEIQHKEKVQTKEPGEKLEKIEVKPISEFEIQLDSEKVGKETVSEEDKEIQHKEKVKATDDAEKITKDPGEKLDKLEFKSTSESEIQLDTDIVSKETAGEEDKEIQHKVQTIDDTGKIAKEPGEKLEKIEVKSTSESEIQLDVEKVGKETVSEEDKEIQHKEKVQTIDDTGKIAKEPGEKLEKIEVKLTSESEIQLDAEKVGKETVSEEDKGIQHKEKVQAIHATGQIAKEPAEKLEKFEVKSTSESDIHLGVEKVSKETVSEEDKEIQHKEKVHAIDDTGKIAKEPREKIEVMPTSESEIQLDAEKYGKEVLAEDKGLQHKEIVYSIDDKISKGALGETELKLSHESKIQLDTEKVSEEYKETQRKEKVQTIDDTEKIPKETSVELEIKSTGKYDIQLDSEKVGKETVIEEDKEKVQIIDDTGKIAKEPGEKIEVKSISESEIQLDSDKFAKPTISEEDKEIQHKGKIDTIDGVEKIAKETAGEVGIITDKSERETINGYKEIPHTDELHTIDDTEKIEKEVLEEVEIQSTREPDVQLDGGKSKEQTVSEDITLQHKEKLHLDETERIGQEILQEVDTKSAYKFETQLDDDKFGRETVIKGEGKQHKELHPEKEHAIDGPEKIGKQTPGELETKSHETKDADKSEKETINGYEELQSIDDTEKIAKETLGEIELKSTRESDIHLDDGKSKEQPIIEGKEKEKICFDDTEKHTQETHEKIDKKSVYEFENLEDDKYERESIIKDKELHHKELHPIDGFEKVATEEAEEIGIKSIRESEIHLVAEKPKNEIFIEDKQKLHSIDDTGKIEKEILEDIKIKPTETQSKDQKSEKPTIIEDKEVQYKEKLHSVDDIGKMAKESIEEADTKLAYELGIQLDSGKFEKETIIKDKAKPQTSDTVERILKKATEDKEITSISTSDNQLDAEKPKEQIIIEDKETPFKEIPHSTDDTEKISKETSGELEIKSTDIQLDTDKLEKQTIIEDKKIQHKEKVQAIDNTRKIEKEISELEIKSSHEPEIHLDGEKLVKQTIVEDKEIQHKEKIDVIDGEKIDKRLAHELDTQLDTDKSEKKTVIKDKGELLHPIDDVGKTAKETVEETEIISTDADKSKREKFDKDKGTQREEELYSTCEAEEIAKRTLSERETKSAYGSEIHLDAGKRETQIILENKDIQQKEEFRSVDDTEKFGKESLGKIETTLTRESEKPAIIKDEGTSHKEEVHLVDDIEKSAKKAVEETEIKLTHKSDSQLESGKETTVKDKDMLHKEEGRLADTTKDAAKEEIKLTQETDTQPNVEQFEKAIIVEDKELKKVQPIDDSGKTEEERVQEKTAKGTPEPKIQIDTGKPEDRIVTGEKEMQFKKETFPIDDTEKTVKETGGKTEIISVHDSEIKPDSGELEKPTIIRDKEIQLKEMKTTGDSGKIMKENVQEVDKLPMSAPEIQLDTEKLEKQTHDSKTQSTVCDPKKIETKEDIKGTTEIRKQDKEGAIILKDADEDRKELDEIYKESHVECAIQQSTREDLHKIAGAADISVKEDISNEALDIDMSVLLEDSKTKVDKDKIEDAMHSEMSLEKKTSSDKSIDKIESSVPEQIDLTLSDKEEQCKKTEEKPCDMEQHKEDSKKENEKLISLSDSKKDVKTESLEIKIIEEKTSLDGSEGKKLIKDREEDVIKIVATVAEVLKSDAPLEEFEGKLPISFDACKTTYVTELRETHITTMESADDAGTILSIVEEPPISTRHDETDKIMKQTSDAIKEILERDIDNIEEQGVVQRMLVTASSEDGGEEIEICPAGTITFSKSSESSGRSSPEKSQESKKSSIVDTISDSVNTVTQLLTREDEKGSVVDVHAAEDIYSTSDDAIRSREIEDIDDEIKYVHPEQHQTEFSKDPHVMDGAEDKSITCSSISDSKHAEDEEDNEVSVNISELSEASPKKLEFEPEISAKLKIERDFTDDTKTVDLTVKEIGLEASTIVKGPSAPILESKTLISEHVTDKKTEPVSDIPDFKGDAAVPKATLEFQSVQKTECQTDVVKSVDEDNKHLDGTVATSDISILSEGKDVTCKVVDKSETLVKKGEKEDEGREKQITEAKVDGDKTKCPSSREDYISVKEELEKKGELLKETTDILKSEVLPKREKEEHIDTTEEKSESFKQIRQPQLESDVLSEEQAVLPKEIEKEITTKKSEKQFSGHDAAISDKDETRLKFSSSESLIQDDEIAIGSIPKDVCVTSSDVDGYTEKEVLLLSQSITGSITPPTVPVSPGSSQACDIDLENNMEKKHKDNLMYESFYGTLPGDPSVELEQSQMEPSYLFEITNAKYISQSSTSKADKIDSDERKGSGEETLKASSIAKDSSSDKPEKYSAESTEWHDKKLECADGKSFDMDHSRLYLYEITKAKNFLTSTHDDERKKQSDTITSWGKPLGLPSPAPTIDNKGTPKKERKLPLNVTVKNKWNDDKKRSESPSKTKNKKMCPIYVDLTYVPHHGNSYYSYVDFFKIVRARYYVFSGIEPGREVYNALLEAKQTWDDKELEVTIIPTYDTDVLGYWVAENEELLTKCKIDLSPSASRCTINLQDHETSCSAYRLEF